jgi:CDP-diglyceride synthetase
MMAAISAGLFGQLGDLTESAMKRWQILSGIGSNV